MKRVRVILVFVLLLCVSLDVCGTDYYGRAVAKVSTTSSGAGSVYVSTTNSDAGASYTQTSEHNFNARDDDDPVTHYFFAKPQNSIFAGWSETDGGTIVGTGNPLSVSCAKTSTSNSSPTITTRYANFIQPRVISGDDLVLSPTLYKIGASVTGVVTFTVADAGDVTYFSASISGSGFSFNGDKTISGNTLSVPVKYTASESSSNGKNEGSLTLNSAFGGSSITVKLTATTMLLPHFKFDPLANTNDADFGTIMIGQESEVRTFTFTTSAIPSNAFSWDMVAIPLDGPFIITNQSFNPTTGKGSISVKFKPTAEIAYSGMDAMIGVNLQNSSGQYPLDVYLNNPYGLYRIEHLLAGTYQNSDLLMTEQEMAASDLGWQLPIHGEGVSPLPRVIVDPDSYDFGTVVVNTTSTHDFDIETKLPGIELTSASLSSPSGAYSIVSTQRLAANKLHITIQFAPNDVKSYSEELTLTTTNAAGSATTTIAVEGIGLSPVPYFTITPAEEDFGDVVVGQSSSGHTFTITTAHPDITISSISCTADPAYSYVASNGNKTLTFTFRPQRGGEYSKEITVTVTNTYGSATQTIILHGTGLDYGPIAEDENIYVWKTSPTNSDWNTVSNWQVITGSGPAAAENYPNGTKHKVILKAGATTYPTLSTSITINELSVEPGARLGNQYLLTYSKAFVELSVPVGKYVRITPPLQGVYSGDMFSTAQAGKAGEGFGNFVASSFVDGNRVTNGQTDQCLYSTSTLYYDAETYVDGEQQTVKTEQVVNDWSTPFNAMQYQYETFEGFDLKILENDENNVYGTGNAILHFPSGDTEYSYYNTRGKKLSLKENLTRPANGYKLAYDLSSVNADGEFDAQITRSGSLSTRPIFTLGNPTLAYMSIEGFLKENVKAGYTTPYLFRQIPASGDSHGQEQIYYYNVNTGLVKVNTAAASTSALPMTDVEATGTVAVTSDAEKYINPSEGFIVVGGTANIEEPGIEFPASQILGKYAANGNNYYQFATGLFLNEKLRASGSGDIYGGNGSSNVDLSQINNKIVENDIVISPLIDGSTNKVCISNFLGNGLVIGEIQNATSTGGEIHIARGFVTRHLPSSGWTNGNKDLNLYGCNSTSITYNGTYVEIYDDYEKILCRGNHREYRIKRVSNLSDGDIVLYYTINPDGSVSLDNNNYPFVTYSTNFLNYTITSASATHMDECDGDRSQNFFAYKGIPLTTSWSATTPNSFVYGTHELESFYVYKKMQHAKNDVGSGDFLYKDIEGVYTTKVNKNSGAGESAGATLQLTIQRMKGTTNMVGITGLCSTSPNTIIVGIISGSAGSYTLTIPAKQFVKGTTGDSPWNHYYLYSGSSASATSTDIVMTESVSGSTITWTSSSLICVSQHHEKSSKNYYTLSSSTSSTQCAFTFKEEIQGLETTIEESTEKTAVNIRFTPNMFGANYSDFAGRTYAPAINKEKSPVLTITASLDSLQASTMVVVDENASARFSIFEDAPVIDADTANLCIGTMAGENIVAVNVTNKVNAIPLFLTKSANLRVDNIAAIGTSATLYDALENSHIVIKEGQPFWLEVKGDECYGRYYIRSYVDNTINQPSAIDDVGSNKYNPFVYEPAKGTIVVNTGTNELTDITLYTITGKMVATTTGASALQTYSGLPSGTYIVRVLYADEVKYVKTIVK